MKKKLNKVRKAIKRWANKQGHNRCWFYPEIFKKIANILDVDIEVEKGLPPIEEFEEGCSQYRDEEYGVTKFRTGNTVVFAPENLNPDYWNKLSEEDRIKYYGSLGYGQEELKTFTFICEMTPQRGHCILIEIGTGKIEIMRHTSDFRLATDDEC